MIVCIVEDRKSFEVPVKLLILSLARHCPGLPVELFFPTPSRDFSDWLAKFPNVKLNQTQLAQDDGWNIKPQALLTLLRNGHDEVVWIDSDIIVTRDFRSAFNCLPAHTIGLTEEALWGSYSDANAWRAARWGLEIGRSLPFTVNTGVIRVTQAHIPLLTTWQDLLASKDYRDAQRLETAQRPGHLFGDQDVLTALLSSTEFADIDIRFLRRGSEIIQYFGLSGYTCAERIKNAVKGPPCFVHSQVFKPWVKFDKPRSIENLRDLFDTLYLDLSHYTLAAAKYTKDLDEPCPWVAPQSAIAAVMRGLGLWYPPLVGLPIAALADFVRVTNLQFAKRFYFRRASLR